MIVYYKNILRDNQAVVTASSVYTAYPLGNLVTDRLTERTKLGTGDQFIQIDTPLPVSINAAIIAGGNFTAATLQTTDDNWVTSENRIELVPDGDHLIGRSSEMITAQSFRIAINSANVKTLSHLLIGASLQMPGMEIGQKISYETTEKSTRSISGQVYPTTGGYETIGFDVSFPRVKQSQKDEMLAMWKTVRNQRAFFTHLWGNRSDKLPLMFAILDQNNFTADRIDGKIFEYKTKLTIQEAK